MDSTNHTAPVPKLPLGHPVTRIPIEVDPPDYAKMMECSSAPKETTWTADNTPAVPATRRARLDELRRHVAEMNKGKRPVYHIHENDFVEKLCSEIDEYLAQLDKVVEELARAIMRRDILAEENDKLRAHLAIIDEGNRRLLKMLGEKHSEEIDLLKHPPGSLVDIAPKAQS